jgi:hypothetical protein
LFCLSQKSIHGAVPSFSGQVPEQMMVFSSQPPLTFGGHDARKPVTAPSSGLGSQVSALIFNSGDSKRPWMSASGTSRTRSTSTDVGTASLAVPKGMTSAPGAGASPSDRLIFLEYQLESLPDGWDLLGRFEPLRGCTSRRKGGVQR